MSNVCPSMLGFDYFESHEKKLSFSLRIVIVGKSILYSNLQYAALASSTARAEVMQVGAQWMALLLLAVSIGSKV